MGENGGDEKEEKENNRKSIVYVLYVHNLEG